MSRSHIGRWTPLHKALFAVAACIAAVGIMAIAAPLVLAAKPGVNTHVAGACGVRVSITSANGRPALKAVEWSITSDAGVLTADGTNHTARVYIPAGTYTFKSESFEAKGKIGTSTCDGKLILHTFSRSLP